MNDQLFRLGTRFGAKQPLFFAGKSMNTCVRPAMVTAYSRGHGRYQSIN
jgi:hypothetical protein